MTCKKLPAGRIAGSSSQEVCLGRLGKDLPDVVATGFVI